MNISVPFLSQASLNQDRHSIEDKWAKHNSDQADPEIHKVPHLPFKYYFVSTYGL